MMMNDDYDEDGDDDHHHDTKFRRVNSKERGRHLVATRELEKGELIFCERPLLALQSLENITHGIGVTVCYCCKGFLGGPDFCLSFRPSTGQRPPYTRAAISEWQRQQQQEHDGGGASMFPIIPCRHECGFLFCSEECEADAWNGFHSCLCTGLAKDMSHPIVQFKSYCLESNEILLLVAEWWVAQHLCSSQNNSTNNKKRKKESAYQDFVMNPWWDVVVVNDDSNDDLQQSLCDICNKAADLLEPVFAPFADRVPKITPLDIACRIGACEQNAMGIRQRHPLCRDVLEYELLKRRLPDIIASLEQAGFMGDEDHEDEDDHENEDSKAVAEDFDSDDRTTNPNNVETDQVQGIECEYSVNEIATFLAGLFFDEEGTVRDESLLENKNGDNDHGDHSNENCQRDDVGDDMDHIFTPLDGTAMYALACKMNHSCTPNVVLLYKPCGYGHPLTAYAVALRDVQPGEELTISYIELKDASYHDRQEALKTYGFTCACSKCLVEFQQISGKVNSDKADETDADDMEDLFGDGKDSDDDDDDDDVERDEVNSEECVKEGGLIKLQRRVERLDTVSNHSLFGSVSRLYHARTSAFVLQTVASLVSSSEQSTPSTITNSVDKNKDQLLLHLDLLKKCSQGLVNSDFSMCRLAGCELEQVLWDALKRCGSFDLPWPRRAYCCAALTACMGLAHQCRFLEAMQLIDKAMVLGLTRCDQVGGLISHVEDFAAQIANGPYTLRGLSGQHWHIPSLETLSTSNLLPTISLERRCAELDQSPSSQSFMDEYVRASKPLVVRGFARAWPAFSKWQNLEHIAESRSHRLVPVELGSMPDSTNGGMKEEFVTFRHLMHRYLLPSNAKGLWSLEDATASTNMADIAYLAQHRLLEQMPSLGRDLEELTPSLCGKSEPLHMNMSIGTGGTRTPLQFDSCDNLLVQVVGAKYVRLYPPSETSSLYVMNGNKASYGLQGNMSEIDCEQEDSERHPLAKDAKFEEVVLLPGDMLYIPIHWWHYVRALSTSVGVNYWF